MPAGVHQVPDLGVLAGERGKVGAGLVVVAEQERERRVPGQRGSDEVERLGPLGCFGLAVLLAAQLGDRDVENVGHLPQHGHAVDWADASLDLGHPAFRAADQPGELDLG